MINRRSTHYFVILALCFSLIHSLQSMNDFRKGFGEGVGKGFAKNLSRNDKGFLDFALDLLWINFILGPSTTTRKIDVDRPQPKIADYKDYSRKLTRLAKHNETIKFMQEENHIKKDNNYALTRESLRKYKNHLQKQADSPGNKSFIKIVTNGVLCGSIATAFGVSRYYSLIYGFKEPDVKLIGAGCVFGLSAILSCLFTQERIVKHLPSSITNRKREKIINVNTAFGWVKSLKEHDNNTDLILV